MALAPSSPRLPSPPPPAEIQISPNSPPRGTPASPHATMMDQSVLEANSKRRIHPGTKAADMAAGPPLVPLSELDSAFQLQEHLAALHYHHTGSKTQPITRDAAVQIATPPAGVDRTIWLYELCRFLISQCNSLIVGFLFDSPPCSATTCPEMRASEWQFLCAVHEQPKSCCAIDYCCHTLDWAANVVSDQKLFPSRFAVLSDAHSKNAGVKNLVNVFRRLHRIFAHAWFQHRSVFWSIEGQSGLYILFKAVCDLYDLLPSENYKLPPEAEGLDGTPAEPEVVEKPPPVIIKPPSQQRQSVLPDDDSLPPSSRSTTRRHIRSSPSTGSAVTTVLETDEEDTDNVSGKMRALRLPGRQQEPEVAEVPVIMEEQSAMAETAFQDPEPNPESFGEAESLISTTTTTTTTESADSDSVADVTVIDEAESPAARDELLDATTTIHSGGDQPGPQPAEAPNNPSEPAADISEDKPHDKTEDISGTQSQDEPQDEPKDMATSSKTEDVDSPNKKNEAQTDDIQTRDMTGESGQVMDPE
ncbi:hypothetical protein E4U43_005344 [Claviceps pusilla]|uniref:Cell cycle regulation Mob3 n=1 Tax=Claviceps pusilla TaxID=123648 RepID=A0A9P7N316_9HYPO|nr:hypothetical protein E4U43_005344 [Claviceps pusilla]